jgi:hypothetical protein
VTGYLAIYSSSGGVPGTLLAATSPSSTIAAGTNVIPLTSPLTIAAGTYFIAGDASGAFYVCRDTTADNTYYSSLAESSGPPAAYPPTSTFSDDQIAFWVEGH